MEQNPHNAALHLGHTNGCVTVWTPNVSTPVVKMLCHRGPLTALAVDVEGMHMVTAGVDGQVKVWDIRLMRPLHAYFSHSPASSLEISQRGLLAVGYGRTVQVSDRPAPTVVCGVGQRGALGEKQIDSFESTRAFPLSLPLVFQGMARCPAVQAAGPVHEPWGAGWDHRGPGLLPL